LTGFQNNNFTPVTLPRVETTLLVACRNAETVTLPVIGRSRWRTTFRASRSWYWRESRS